MFYKFFTSNLAGFSRRACRSWDCTQPIPRSRMAFESEICIDWKRPFFFRITRTDSSTNAAINSPVTISTLFIYANH